MKTSTLLGQGISDESINNCKFQESYLTWINRWETWNKTRMRWMPLVIRWLLTFATKYTMSHRKRKQYVGPPTINKDLVISRRMLTKEKQHFLQHPQVIIIRLSTRSGFFYLWQTPWCGLFLWDSVIEELADMPLEELAEVPTNERENGFGEPEIECRYQPSKACSSPIVLG